MEVNGWCFNRLCWGATGTLWNWDWVWALPMGVPCLQVFIIIKLKFFFLELIGFLISSLRVSYCIFYHSHTYPQLFPDRSPFPDHSPLCPFGCCYLLDLFDFKCKSYCPYALGCVVMHWSRWLYQRTYPLRKLTPPLQEVIRYQKLLTYGWVLQTPLSSLYLSIV